MSKRPPNERSRRRPGRWTKRPPTRSAANSNGPPQAAIVGGAYARELAAAQDAALSAGKVIKELYAAGRIVVGQKGVDSPVTDADLRANDIIRTRILTEFAGDGWLSEETEDLPERTEWNRVWVVDPLDGTKEFIDQVGEFCVSVALVEGGRARLGVIYNPITEELFVGAEDEPLLLNGKTMTLRATRDLRTATVLASRSENGRGEWDRFRDRFKVKLTGSVAYKLALIAAGKADATFTLTPKHEWDVCAGAALIEAAGGRISDCEGQPLVFNRRVPPLLPGIIAAHPELHQRLVSLLAADRRS